MPKVRPLTETARKDENLSKQLWGEMKVAKVSGEQLAQTLGIGKNTFYRRMKKPSTFTLGELRALQKIFPNIVIE